MDSLDTGFESDLESLLVAFNSVFGSSLTFTDGAGFAAAGFVLAGSGAGAAFGVVLRRSLRRTYGLRTGLKVTSSSSATSRMGRETSASNCMSCYSHQSLQKIKTPQWQGRPYLDRMRAEAVDVNGRDLLVLSENIFMIKSAETPEL